MFPLCTDILFGKNDQQNSGLLRPKKMTCALWQSYLPTILCNTKKTHICWAKSSPTTVKPLELESIHKKLRELRQVACLPAP